MTRTSYAIAIGSNRRGRHGSPAHEVAAAVLALDDLVAVSPVMASAPMGPSQRRFANAVALIESDKQPPALLAELKRIERSFGRRPARRWGDRVIDLDIVLWSGGTWAEDDLTVPHTDFRGRDFVLAPLADVVPNWRDPVSGLTVRHLLVRAMRRRAARVGP